MKIKLTQQQVNLLRPYFDRVKAAAVLGSPGMLIAQLRHDGRNDVYTLEPAFLENPLAATITEKGRELEAVTP